MNRHTSRLIVAALVMTLLAACSADKGSNTTPTGKPSPTQGATSDPSKNGANELGIDAPDLSKTIISKQFAIPGSSQRKVTVGILSLERKGKVAVLKVVVTPEFADLKANETVPFGRALGQFGFHWTPDLLDLTNLKKYTVLWTDSKWLNYEDGEAVSGQPIYGWAVFAAPPAEVTSVDLTVTDWMPRFTKVPIT